jgi:AcrR family transcriptional regulator
VPRTRPPERLDDIAEAAFRVFAAKGYRNARMDEVARVAGVSPGLLYNYAEDKEALFQFVLQRELGVDLDDAELPIRKPDAAELATVSRRAMREVGTIASLEAALRTKEPTDVVDEVGTIIGEHYDRIHKFRRFIRVSERAALDWPEQAELVFERGRRPYVRRLGNYIDARVRGGYFTPVPDPEVAARWVVESVAWFANHRYGDHDGGQIDDGVARTTVVQLVTAGLVGQRPAGKRR